VRTERLLEYAMDKHTLHGDLLLSVQQASACIFAFNGGKTSRFCFSLKIFCCEEVTSGAIKTPVQLLSQLLLRWQPEMSQIIQAMIPGKQQATRPQCLCNRVIAVFSARHAETSCCCTLSSTHIASDEMTGLVTQAEHKWKEMVMCLLPLLRDL